MKGQTVLVTGGTGTFGNAVVPALLEAGAEKVVVFSRDELKQHEMAQRIISPRLRFFLGDVRDVDRLMLAFRDVSVVIHAAALKQVPACEYNPFEAVKTNILGAQNVVTAAVQCGVQKVVALSSDKATNPVNLYGATKLCSEKLFAAANVYRGWRPGPLFSCVRYGNVAGSRGSVIPVFRQLLARGDALTVTDVRMTRFWLTLPQAVDVVTNALQHMRGGEVFVPKLPSFKVIDLAVAMSPKKRPWKITGVRPGEKLHEALIGPDERATDRGGYWVLSPDGTPGHAYTSDTNTDWLDAGTLKHAVEALP